MEVPMAGPTIAEAVASYLDGAELARSSRRTYGVSLRRMARELGPARPLGEVSDAEAAGWFQTAHGASMPASWNRERLTVRSAARWWREQGWTAPSFQALRRRRVKQDRTRALPRHEIERVLALDTPLREKTLWRLLYESAARAEEVLALDVEDLDLPNRHARVVSKGGDVEWIMWQTGTARLLPRLLAGRRTGPVFTTRVRSRSMPAALDADPAGYARLSYRRAAELFTDQTGHTLHQLRHSALTHAAEDGWSTPMLMARSRHRSVASLAKYAKPSPEAVARLLAEQDPARRSA
jgi:integrase